MSSVASVTQAIPEHVPAELVRNTSIFTAPGMERQENGDPQAALSVWHQGPPIFYAPHSTYKGEGAWVIVRAEHQRKLLQDAITFSSNRGLFTEAMGEEWPMVPLEYDPPQHTAYRSLLNPLLSPQRVATMEGAARARAVDLIESFREKGGCEAVQDFAYPFAVNVFLQFLGLPDSRRPEFLAWAEKLLHGTLDERYATMKTIRRFLEDLADLRRREPAQDFMTFVVNARVNGEPMTEKQVSGMATLLFVGGLDTVAAAIGFDLNHLARHPDEQARLRANPELIKGAVEELLRAYSTITPIRRATRDVTFEGVFMKKGDMIICPSMVANRDPAEFPNPDKIDLAREDNRHVAFAYGPHRCIGSHLARRELVIGLEEWLARIGPFRIREGIAPITYGGYVFGIENLQLSWD
jgi:cytochrome P450